MSFLSRLSFSSLALVNDPFEWAYRLEGLGFTGWEIVSEGRQTLTDETMKKVVDIIETTNLQLSLHLPFSDLNLASLNPYIWQETVRQQMEYLERASSFIKIAVVHPGHLSPLGTQLPDMAWANNIKGIKKLCEFADDFGVMVCIENMVNQKYVFGKDAAEIEGMVETIGCDNLGITFDIGHANTNNMIDEFLSLKQKISHVHAHDNHGETDEHLPVGDGIIDWNKIIKGLSNFKGRVVLESRNVDEGEKGLKYLHKIWNGV